MSSPDSVSVPDGTKSWNTWIGLYSAAPPISVRIALAADGSTVASAAPPSTLNVPPVLIDRIEPVRTCRSLLSVRVPDPSNSYLR